MAHSANGRTITAFPHTESFDTEADYYDALVEQDDLIATFVHESNAAWDGSGCAKFTFVDRGAGVEDMTGVGPWVLPSGTTRVNIRCEVFVDSTFISAFDNNENKLVIVLRSTLVSGQRGIAHLKTANNISATFSSRSSDVITTTAAHGFGDGTAVRYQTTGTAIGGLTHNTVYWVDSLTTTTMSLATSKANAIAHTVISLTSDGSGTHTFTQVANVWATENIEINTTDDGAQPLNSMPMFDWNKYVGQTVSIEFEFNVGGEAKTYIDTQDGVFSSNGGTTPYQTVNNISTGGTWIQVQTLFGYWESGGPDSFYRIPRAVIRNAFIGPPTGFVTEEEEGGTVATIGNTLTGGNTRDISALIKGIRVPSFPENGTINTITARCTGNGTSSWRAMVYTQAGALVASSDIRTVGAAGNYDFTFSSGSLVAGTDYTFAVGTDQATGALIHFTGASETYEGQAYASAADIDPTPPDPVTWTADTTRDYCIQVTYTTAATASDDKGRLPSFFTGKYDLPPAKFIQRKY